MIRAPWTDADLAVLTSLYATTRSDVIAARLGCSLGRVYNKAFALGLKKADGFMSQLAKETGLATSGTVTRFQKGLVPFNKGVKGINYPGMRATQFKAGRPASEAANYRPVGSLRVCADGLLERKMTDDPGIVPARRWVGVHRLVWEAAHGAIPGGHIVAFRPGMQTAVEADITPDRLECITRAENMRRNTIHNLPLPVVEAITAVRGLRRRISTAEKKGESRA